jgi:predicted nucleotidyltransferase component of viral defense system
MVDLGASRSGVPRSHVEKDFWLTEVLRGVLEVSQRLGLPVVLKGGTSLSKAHRLIERFSEDVDVLVDLGGLSANKGKRALKDFRDGVSRHLGIPGDVDTAKTVWETRLAVHFPYPSRTRDHRLVGLRPEGVLLEIGAWGGALPNRTMELRSIISEHAAQDIGDYEEVMPVHIRVVAPERTAVEKVMILHTAADEQRRSITARHYYDLHRLLSDRDVIAALKDGAAPLLAREIHIHSRALGVPTQPRPTSGLHTSRSFDTTDPALRPARRSYESVVLAELLWPSATVRPSFDECCELVRSASYL